MPEYTGAHKTFADECEAAGMVVEHYRRRDYEGPAVITDEGGWPTRLEVIRATTGKLQWDNMGRDDLVVYPA